MPNIFIEDYVFQSTSSACIVDITPPTFAGITGLDVESRGQIRANWSAATDATAPIRYEVYIKATTSVGLFNTSNIISVTPNLQFDIFTLPDGSFLQNGTTYHVGVRAIDGVSNRDSNTTSMSVISTGVLTAIDVYECKASLSVDETNNFRITMWADKNNSLAISPSAVLGTASFQVYDRDGNAVGGMSGSGISANGQGLFVASGVANSLSEIQRHYEVKVTISIDGENRTNFIKIESEQEIYELDGLADIDDANNIIGSLWVHRNHKIATTNLGTGSYEVFTSDGVAVPGLSQSGITADANGFFVITPLALPSNLDVTKGFVVKLTCTIDGVLRSKFITLGNEPAVFDCKATFNINASNQLEASFWATKNNNLVPQSMLGTASYQVYDKSGNTVVGLNGSGIAADANGYFHITPVSATLLTDLTHYLVKVTINVAGQDRVSTKGFTLLGT